MGRVIVAGAGRMTIPITGTLASDLAVGTVVKLMEGDTAVEYLVVNQGIPENSSLYDSSCDGTWLLRKDIHSIRQWSTSSSNDYATSSINTWLNGEFFNGFGGVEQSTIKQVKIPYSTGGVNYTINSGVNGLDTKVFLVGNTEVNFASSPVDGAKLDYFGTDTTNRRIAYYNGSISQWYLRSAAVESSRGVIYIDTDGTSSSFNATSNLGIRPALILPFTARFDKDTLILKG